MGFFCKCNDIFIYTREPTSSTIFKNKITEQHYKASTYFSFNKGFFKNCIFKYDLLHCNLIANFCVQVETRKMQITYFSCVKNIRLVRQCLMYNLLTLNFLNIIDVNITLGVLNCCMMME